MASTMLHYIIASKIVKELDIEDAESFLIGALLPDASEHEDKSYFSAHFMETKGNKKGFNWQEFKNKYYDEVQKDSIYQGYMCHIIMDAVWFQLIADKYIRIYPQTIRQEYYKKAYRDYWKLNDILPRKYGISKPVMNIPKISITEIHDSLVTKVIDGLQEQFDISERYETTDMELIPYSAIEEYIDRSIELCIKELTNVSKKECYINPENLYVEK